MASFVLKDASNSRRSHARSIGSKAGVGLGWHETDYRRAYSHYVREVMSPGHRPQFRMLASLLRFWRHAYMRIA